MSNGAMSQRGLALVRTFRAAFEALAEHGKKCPVEQTQIAEVCAAHLRSAWPMAAAEAPAPLDTGPVPRVETDGPIRCDLGDGAFYELSRLEDGRGALYLADASKHDAGVPLTADQARSLCQDLSDLMELE